MSWSEGNSPREPAPARPTSFDDWSTEELVSALKRKDERAWSQLGQNVRSILTLLMRKRVPTDARRRFDTDDLCQSVMFRAFRDIDAFEYRGEKSFRSWLVTIFVNRLRSRLRAQNAQRRELGREQELSPDLAGASPAARDDTLEHAEQLADLVFALSKLPAELQRILALRVSDHMSSAETSLELGISERTVRRRFAAAVAELQRLLHD